MQPSMRWLVVGTALCALSISFGVAAKDARLGKWKLNVEKSKFDPGPGPKSLKLVFEPAGKGVHLKTEQVNADDSKGGVEYTANFDGKDYPLKGSPIADMTSLKRVDATTVIRIDKKDGKPVMTYRSVTTKDGKSYTVDTEGTNAKGEAVKNHLVFERE